MPKIWQFSSGENSALQMSPDHILFYLSQSRNWIKRARTAQKGDQKFTFKSKCPDYMHVPRDFSGLHSHLMPNAKEQQYLKPEALILSSTMSIQTVHVGQLSILGIILGYKRFSNVVPYKNLFAHNGHKFRTFKCTKSFGQLCCNQ